MIRKTLTCLAVGAALAACAQTAEQIAEADIAKCTVYGYPIGHADHGLCRMVLDQQRLDAEATRQAAAASNPGLAIAGAALLGQALYPQPVVPAYRAPTTCNFYTSSMSCY